MKPLKFKKFLGGDSVKLIFTTQQLRQKPIKYWSNVGNIHPNSTLQTFIKYIKKLCGDKTANGILNLYYYGGSRLLFPFHVNWLKDGFELQVFNCFGDGDQTLFIKRKVSSQNERFTKDEIKQINDFIRVEYHKVWDTYRRLKLLMKDAKTYQDVRDKLKENITIKN